MEKTKSIENESFNNENTFSLLPNKLENMGRSNPANNKAKLFAASSIRYDCA
jgi:hypothetical protein